MQNIRDIVCVLKLDLNGLFLKCRSRAEENTSFISENDKIVFLNDDSAKLLNILNIHVLRSFSPCFYGYSAFLGVFIVKLNSQICIFEEYD